MYKNKANDGRSNICGLKIKEIRMNLPKKTSQKQFAEMLQEEGLYLDKNAIQKIEEGTRFVTDIEIKVIAKILKTTISDLLD